MTIETKLMIALICIGIAILSSVITMIIITLGPSLKDAFNFKKRRQIKKQLQSIINERKKQEEDDRIRLELFGEAYMKLKREERLKNE